MWQDKFKIHDSSQKTPLWEQCWVGANLSCKSKSILVSLKTLSNARLMTIITLNRGGGGLGLEHPLCAYPKILLPSLHYPIPKKPGLLWPRRKQQPEPGVLQTNPRALVKLRASPVVFQSSGMVLKIRKRDSLGSGGGSLERACASSCGQAARSSAHAHNSVTPARNIAHDCRPPADQQWATAAWVQPQQCCVRRLAPDCNSQQWYRSDPTSYNTHWL